MAGKSPESKNSLPVTLDSLVIIKKSDEQGEYVALKFGLFPENEEAVRQAFATYIAGMQIEGGALAEEGESRFFTMTHLSASDVYKRVQERWQELEQRSYVGRVSAARLPPAK